MIAYLLVFLTENPTLASFLISPSTIALGYWLMRPSLALLLLLLAIFFLVVVPYLESKKPYEGVPLCPKSHWLLGHVHLTHGRDTFPESFLFVFRDNADTSGRTGYWWGNKACISTINVEDARLILRTEYQRSSIPIVSHFFNKAIGPKNILWLNGREWKQNRDAVTRTFAHSFLVQSQQDVYQVTHDLIATFKEKIDCSSSEREGRPYEVDVLPVMKMLTSDVIGKAVFGTDFECCKTLRNSPVVGAFEYILNDMNQRSKNPLLPWNYFFSLPIENNHRLDEQLCLLRGFIENLLQQSRFKMMKLNSNASSKKMDGNGNKPKISLVDRLVVANDATGENCSSDQVLIDVVSTLLIASYDTTSTTLAFALYLLSIHPDIQDKCFQEVDSIGKTYPDSKLTDPNQLIYCTSLIKESLRIFPPANLVDRTLTKDVTLGDGFVAPKGAHMAVPIFAIHRDERNFPQPLECRPERWCQRKDDNNTWVERDFQKEQESGCKNSSSTIAAGNPDALIPFSVGGRNCPGGKFALQEAVLVLANLVRHLQFSPVPGYELKLRVKSVLPYPANGMPLRIDKR